MEPLNPEVVAKRISGFAKFREVYLDASKLPMVICRTSAAMPKLDISKHGIFIFFDLRFFDLLRHALIGLTLFDKPIKLPTGGTFGRFHLESLLWTLIAERSLNPRGKQDLALAVGILLQESMHYDHSRMTMQVNATKLEVPEFSDDMSLNWFQTIAMGHEMAHFDFKTGERWNDEDLTLLKILFEIIDRQLDELRVKPKANPTIVEMFAAAQSLRKPKIRFEEALADMEPIKAQLRGDRMPPEWMRLSFDIRFKIVSRAVLFGLAGARVMGFAEVLLSEDQESFDRRWTANRELFIGRSTMATKFMSTLAFKEPVENYLEGTAEELDRHISIVTHELHDPVRRAENHIMSMYPRIAQFRREGQDLIDRDEAKPEQIFEFCSQMLGWFRTAQTAE